MGLGSNYKKLQEWHTKVSDRLRKTTTYNQDGIEGTGLPTSDNKNGQIYKSIDLITLDIRQLRTGIIKSRKTNELNLKIALACHFKRISCTEHRVREGRWSL